MRRFVPRAGPLHILTIEDNPGDVLLVRVGLEECGLQFEMTTAPDGETALAYLRDNAPPDLVLLDLNLPKTSGVQFLQDNRDVLRHIPVVVISASPSPKDRQAALSGGAAVYFQKPNSLDGFVAIAQHLKAWFDRE